MKNLYLRHDWWYDLIIHKWDRITRVPEVNSTKTRVFVTAETKETSRIRKSRPLGGTFRWNSKTHLNRI